MLCILFCTFNFIIDIIQSKTTKKYTINEIKNELYNEYTKYISKYQDKIVDILIIEGKKTLGDQVLGPNPNISFSDFIYTENYFLTTLDLWLLVDRFKIPTIFISKNFILQTDNKYNNFIAYGNLDDDFTFIVIPILKPEIVPNLKLIKTDKGDIFISLKSLNAECLEKINSSFELKVNISEYLESFVKPPKKINKIYEKKIFIENMPTKNKRKKISSKSLSEHSSNENILRNSKNTSNKQLVKKNPKNKTQKI